VNASKFDREIIFSSSRATYSNILNWTILLSRWQVDLLSSMFNFRNFSMVYDCHDK